MKPLIYAVEDDAALQELYTYSLESEFECLCMCDGSAFWVALEKRSPDLILLDIMLPGDDGFTILNRLKSNPVTARIPIIMVSAKGEEMAKVKGLNMGADDYISKPFGILELIARIKANMRKYNAVPAHHTYKDISIDEARHEITINGETLKMTRKEYDLLCLLCENAGSVQSREVIFSKVWGDNFIGETRTLDIHIRQLRKKLDFTNSTVLIKTVRGIGYMMI